jgi:hypothetical protein
MPPGSYFPTKKSLLWEHQWRDLLDRSLFCRPEEFSQFLDLQRRKRIIPDSNRGQLPPHIKLHADVYFKKSHVLDWFRHGGDDEIAERLARKYGVSEE